jgi:hypothetical protein
MARLYRPHIPLAVRVAVASRQLEQRGRSAIVRTVKETTGTWGDQLHHLLLYLAREMECEVADLRLDHDPPLAARPKERRGLSPKTFYTPDANDPDHLFYRPHGPEHAGSHLIKTNIRGDHGQHPDRVLIKKERRREKGPKPKRGPPIKSAGFRTTKMKPKWPKRPFNRSKP